MALVGQEGRGAWQERLLRQQPMARAVGVEEVLLPLLLGERELVGTS